MALRLALDANRYVDFCRGVAATIDLVRRAQLVILPFVVLAELRAGFRGGSKTRRNEQQLASFVREYRVSLLFADGATTHVYADLAVQLRTAGTPIPTNDVWIAAIVLQHGLILHSRDKHFDYLPQVPRI